MTVGYSSRLKSYNLLHIACGIMLKSESFVCLRKCMHLSQSAIISWKSINHASESMTDEDIREVSNEYMQGKILYAFGFIVYKL